MNVFTRRFGVPAEVEGEESGGSVPLFGVLEIAAEPEGVAASATVGCSPGVLITE